MNSLLLNSNVGKSLSTSNYNFQIQLLLPVVQCIALICCHGSSAARLSGFHVELLLLSSLVPSSQPVPQFYKQQTNTRSDDIHHYTPIITRL